MTLLHPTRLVFPVASTGVLPGRVRATLAILLLVLVMPASTLSQPSSASEPMLLDDVHMASLGSVPIVTRHGLVIWLAQTGEMLDGGWWDAEIRGARLPDLEPFVIATGLGDTDFDHGVMATDGRVVVWVDTRDRLTIHGVRLDSGGSFIVAELEPSADGWGPRIGSLAVSGNLVAWSTDDAEVARLQVRDIAGRNPIITLDETPTIEAGFPEIGAVAVDSEWVVWGRHGNNVPWEQVIAHNINTGDEFTIENPGEGRLAANALRNGVLALPVNQGDKNIENPDIALIDVQMIDLRTREVSIVTIQYEEHIAERSNYPYADMFLGFDGRYLYQEFQISLPTSSPGLQQVVVYDTWTGASFPVARDLFWLFRANDGLLAWEVRGGEGALLYAIGLADRLPTASVPDDREPGPDYIWFRETGHSLQLAFKSYWESNGGLPVFGYPLTEEFHELNADTGETYTVQFTERQRFEWHPDNAGTPYEVLLGRLGSELLMLQGRDWTNFPKADPTSPHYFPETGHAIAPEFWSYWSSHGLEFGDPAVTFRESLALFGYPLSKPMIETDSDGHTVLTQYFERAVFEYHPDNHDPYKVLLRRLGAEMLVERDWMDAPDADQERIAFVSNRDGNAEIYVINADGSGIRNLTSHPANDNDPQWSPDRSRILFTSDRSGSTSLYVMDADGSNVTHLTPEPGTYSMSRWSPDGSHIAYAAFAEGTLYESAHLYVIRVDDFYAWQVSENQWVTSLSWAPDGTRIAYATSMYRSMTEAEQDSVIHVVNVDGTNDSPLTLDLGHATDPVWSPDGSRIAFFQGGIASGMPWLESLQTMDPYDGANRLELATCGAGFSPVCYGVSWSPDSSMLAFHRDNTRLDMGDSEILLVSADGSGQRVVYTGDQLSTPSWLPDGFRLVFTADGDIMIFDVTKSEVVAVAVGLQATYRAGWEP